MLIRSTALYAIQYNLSFKIDVKICCSCSVRDQSPSYLLKYLPLRVSKRIQVVCLLFYLMLGTLIHHIFEYLLPSSKNIFFPCAIFYSSSILPFTSIFIILLILTSSRNRRHLRYVLAFSCHNCMCVVSISSFRPASIKGIKVIQLL